MFFVPRDKDSCKLILIHIKQIKKPKKEMNKKDYQKPTMKIVQLQHQCHILAQSDGVQAQRSGYGAANTDTWGGEE